MKKSKLVKAASTFFMAFLILASTACNFTFGGDYDIDEPTVDFSSSVVTLSLPRISKNTQYINVYRQDVTDCDSDYDKATTQSIGLINPNNLTSGGVTYQFQDENVIKTHKYRYMARYRDKKQFSYTAWSRVITIENDARVGFPETTEEKELTYQCTDTPTIVYDEEEITFEIDDAITAPDATLFPGFSNYKPALLVKIKDTNIMSAFELPEAMSKLISGEAESAKFSVKSLLPASYLDTEIEICGIVGQWTQYQEKAEESETETSEEGAEESSKKEEPTPIMRVVWTLPLEVTVHNKSGNIIVVSSSLGDDGLDFSLPIPKEDEKTIQASK